MPGLTAAELSRAIGGTVRGEGDLRLRGMAPLEDAKPDQASFLARADYRHAAEASAAGCIIVASAEDLPGRTVIVAANPYRAFALAMRAFHPDVHPGAGVHPRSEVHPEARLAPGVHVGPMAVVARGAVIESGSVLHAGVVVGEDCSVGEACVLHPGVVLYPRVVLGQRVIVHARAVIGSDGFGYSSGPDGHLKIPHVGRVVVGDDVEIGAGTCIDRGAMGDTVIGFGTKIDNLVQVGHNVSVGAGSLLVAQSGVSGSTRLGKGVVLAGQSGIAGHLSVGDGARIAAKSAVLQDLEPGATVGGIPAISLATWRKSALLMRRLPEIWQRLRKLDGGPGRLTDDGAEADKEDR